MAGCIQLASIFTTLTARDSKKVMLPGLIIRSSSIHAAGCYTMRRIKKGTRVCEYEGPRLSKAEADLRYENRCVTYLFG